MATYQFRFGLRRMGGEEVSIYLFIVQSVHEYHLLFRSRNYQSPHGLYYQMHLSWLISYVHHSKKVALLLLLEGPLVLRICFY